MSMHEEFVTNQNQIELFFVENSFSKFIITMNEDFTE
jgi:hypothetical protein